MQSTAQTATQIVEKKFKCKRGNTCFDEKCNGKHSILKDLLRAAGIYNVNCSGMTQEQVNQIIALASQTPSAPVQPKKQKKFPKKTPCDSKVTPSAPVQPKKQKKFPKKTPCDSEVIPSVPVQSKKQNKIPKKNCCVSKVSESSVCSTPEQPQLIRPAKCHNGKNCKKLLELKCKFYHPESHFAYAETVLLEMIEAAEACDYWFAAETNVIDDSDSETEMFFDPRDDCSIEALTIEQILRQVPTY